MQRLLVLLASLLFASSLNAGEIKDVFAVSEEWEDCTNADGTGLYWDILREVYKLDGIELKHQNAPYARCAKMVQGKEADILVGCYYKEKEGMLYPAKEAFMDADKVVVLFKDGGSYTDQKSLEGKKVGWVRGYDYDKYLEVKVEKQEFGSREQGVKMVQAGRIDFLLDAAVDIEGLDEKLLAGVKVHDCMKLYLYYAFQDTERGKKLIGIYEKNLAKLKESGQLKELFEKYEFDWLW